MSHTQNKYLSANTEACLGFFWKGFMPSLQHRKETSYQRKEKGMLRTDGDVLGTATTLRTQGLQRLDGGAPLPGRHLHQVEVARVELGVCGILILGVHLACAQRTVVLTLKWNGGSTSIRWWPWKQT